MISEYNKGTLIYDESVIPQRKKSIKQRHQLYLGGSIAALCICIFISMYTFLVTKTWYHIIAAVFGILVSIGGIIISFCFDALKIYDNGIEVPWKKILKKEENYIPFSEVALVYISPRKGSNEPIAILKRNGRFRGFDKSDIENFSMFERLIQQKVEITTDINYYQQVRNQIKKQS